MFSSSINVLYFSEDNEFRAVTTKPSPYQISNAHCFMKPLHRVLSHPTFSQHDIQAQQSQELQIEKGLLLKVLGSSSFFVSFIGVVRF